MSWLASPGVAATSPEQRTAVLFDELAELSGQGQVIGCGRTTRQINRRLRRALEHRHPTCAVPGCGATRGLHVHHILVLLCPYHHRLHHRGVITILGTPPTGSPCSTAPVEP